METGIQSVISGSRTEPNHVQPVGFFKCLGSLKPIPVRQAKYNRYTTNIFITSCSAATKKHSSQPINSLNPLKKKVI